MLAAAGVAAGASAGTGDPAILPSVGWGCADEHVKMTFSAYSIYDGDRDIQVGRALGVVVNPSETVATLTVTQAVASGYNTLLTPFEAGQYTWFVRLEDVQDTGVYGDWQEMVYNDPGCGGGGEV